MLRVKSRRFKGRLKILSLWYSIGKDSQDAIDSVDCDAINAGVTYDDVMTHLKKIFW